MKSATNPEQFVQHGLVTTVADGVITVSGLGKARMGELLLIKDKESSTGKSANPLPVGLRLNTGSEIILAVILNLEYNSISALLLDHFSDVKSNYYVYRLYRRLSTIVGDLDI